MFLKYISLLMIIKTAAFIAFTYLFIIVFTDDLQKFKNKITTTGTKTRPYSGKGKRLPCFSICSLPGYKNRGFYFTTKNYTDNTYNPEDFFPDKTLNEFKNKSRFLFAEVQTLFFGRCYKVCSLEEVHLGQAFYWEIKTEFNSRLFLHSDGDEFWLSGNAMYIIDMAPTLIEVNRTDGIKSGKKITLKLLYVILKMSFFIWLM
jgi:hypothetical protein